MLVGSPAINKGDNDFALELPSIGLTVVGMAAPPSGSASSPLG
jgi:hypothetical protein